MIVVTLVIAAMSFYLIALVVWMALHYRTTVAIPHDLVRDIQNVLDQKKYNEAYQRLVGRFIVSGASAGQRSAQTAGWGSRRPSGPWSSPTKTQRWRWNIARPTWPLWEHLADDRASWNGLRHDHGLSRHRARGGTPQASQLAAGISTALYATLEGIAISIPAIFFYAIYRNRIARLSLEVGMAAEPLLEQFVPGVRPATPARQPITDRPQHLGTPHPFAVSAALAADRRQSPRPAPAGRHEQ